MSSEEKKQDISTDAIVSGSWSPEAKYHVQLPTNYFPNKYPEWSKLSLLNREHLMVEEFEKLEVLLGTKEVVFSIHQDDNEGWKIEVVVNTLKRPTEEAEEPPTSIPKGSLLHRLFLEVSKAVRRGNSTFNTHHNVIYNRIHSLEKRHYEIRTAYESLESELTREITALKAEYKRRSPNARGIQPITAKSPTQKANHLQ